MDVAILKKLIQAYRPYTILTILKKLAGYPSDNDIFDELNSLISQSDKLLNSSILTVLIKHFNENNRNFFTAVVTCMRGERFPFMEQFTWGVYDFYKENFKRLLNIFIDEPAVFCSVDNIEMLISMDEEILWLEKQYSRIINEDGAGPVNLRQHRNAEIKRREEEQINSFLQSLQQEIMQLGINEDIFKTDVQKLALRKQIPGCLYTPREIAQLYVMQPNPDIFLKCLALREPKAIRAVMGLVSEINFFNYHPKGANKKINFREFLDETTFTLLNKACEPVYFVTTLITLHAIGLKEKEVIEQFLPYSRSDNFAKWVEQCHTAGLSRDLCKKYLIENKDKAALFFVLSKLAALEPFKQEMIDKILSCANLERLAAKVRAFDEQSMRANFELPIEDFFDSRLDELTEEKFTQFISEVNDELFAEDSINSMRI
ncbi:MAG: hypothetical protein LCH30_08095 [Proteobacteria bacterium]|nr:hypothetical protein [Pseudomonadota bacterium]